MSTPMETIIRPAPEESLSDEQTLADAGFYWRESGGVKGLISKQLEKEGFVNGFSTRLGGVSPFPENSLNLAGFNEDEAENIYENRRRFLRLFPEGLSLALAWQVHGDAIRMVKTESDVGDSEIRADGVISHLRGVLAGVKTADCVAILIGDARAGAFAAVHAGWRGTALSIAAKGIRMMSERFGSLPSNMIAAIGPAACGRDYEVGADVINTFAASFPASFEKYFTPTREGHALVDLHAVNRDQLIGAGIAAENISVAPFCSMERSDLFFSYRIEKKTLGKTGRLLSVIGRTT